MEIAFIYPQMDKEYYNGSVHSFNSQIDIDNLKSLLPRMILYAVRVFIYIVWAVFMYRLFLGVTRFVTAKDVGTIELGLVIYALSVPLSLALIKVLRKTFRPYLLKALRGQEAIESYTYSPYVERSDSDKFAGRTEKYLEACDELKGSKIIDASTVCDGSVCRVEVKYEFGGRTKLRRFTFDYKETDDVDRIIVDFDRRLVIFPEEDIEDEESQTTE